MEGKRLGSGRIHEPRSGKRKRIFFANGYIGGRTGWLLSAGREHKPETQTGNAGRKHRPEMQVRHANREVYSIRIDEISELNQVLAGELRTVNPT